MTIIENLVVLTATEQQMVDTIGRVRQKTNEKANRSSNHTPGFDPTLIHRMGAAGEYVVSSYTGLPWTNKLKSGTRMMNLNHDVGDDIEVRTALKRTHSLAMHRNDDQSLRYVLVLAHRSPIYVVAGWMWGHEMATPEFWRSDLPYPAWMVPQYELHDPSLLKC